MVTDALPFEQGLSRHSLDHLPTVPLKRELAKCDHRAHRSEPGIRSCEMVNGHFVQKRPNLSKDRFPSGRGILCIGKVLYQESLPLTISFRKENPRKEPNL